MKENSLQTMQSHMLNCHRDSRQINIIARNSPRRFSTRFSIHQYYGFQTRVFAHPRARKPCNYFQLSSTISILNFDYSSYGNWRPNEWDGCEIDSTFFVVVTRKGHFQTTSPYYPNQKKKKKLLQLTRIITVL